MNHFNLPVYNQRQRILDALAEHQVLVVESPTGSGKTTQLPIILHEAGYTENGIVGITQPRRIAAVGVSRFIARQLGVELGQYVGYKMRFEDATSPATRLKILTDGTLLQEMKGNRMLSNYSVLMIDEAHERTLNIDFILGQVKELLPLRADLKVIISSATLNPYVFSRYFGDCPIVSIDTPVYPVTVRYAPPPIEGKDEVLVESIAAAVEKIVMQGPVDPRSEKGDRDILVFCSGEKLIKETVARLFNCRVSQQIHVMPLFGRMGSEEQDKVFNPAPEGLIKVVVATNVAETSITIDGVAAVVDSGLVKLNYYNPHTFTSALVETAVSRASADQRKGRAGRTGPGVCWRLYSEDSYNSRQEFTREEIYRTDLAEVVLRMAEIGIRDFETFEFISSPSSKGLHGAVEALRLLDAIDEENGITDIGQEMARYPLMPRHARMIVEAMHRYPDVLKETIIAAAFLSTNAPFLLPQGEELEARRAHHTFRSEFFGDFASYLNLYWEYIESKDRQKFADSHYLDKKIMDEILAIVEQLEEMVGNTGMAISEGGATEDFLKACARGLMPFICIRDGRFDYRSVGADRVIIHPGSMLFRENPEFIVAGEIVQTSRIYARTVSPLRKKWLAEIHPKLPSMLLSGSRKAHGRKRETDNEVWKTDKDTANQIWIAGIPYSMERGSGKRGKKRATLDWKTLHDALAKNKDPIPDFGNMRGRLVLDGMEILPDSKVNTIIKAARFLLPELRQGIPPGQFHLHKAEQRDNLISNLSCLLSVDIAGKPQKGKGKKKSAGFATLFSDGKGCFWFKSLRSFHGAVSVSLESLDELADSNELDEKIIKNLGSLYRSIEKLLY